jgi:hypothetical protein
MTEGERIVLEALNDPRSTVVLERLAVICKPCRMEAEIATDDHEEAIQIMAALFAEHDHEGIPFEVVVQQRIEKPIDEVYVSFVLGNG